MVRWRNLFIMIISYTECHWFLPEKNSSFDLYRFNSFCFHLLYCELIASTTDRFWWNIADNGFQIQSAHSWILSDYFSEIMIMEDFFCFFSSKLIESNFCRKHRIEILNTYDNSRGQREQREENVLLCESSEYVTFVLEMFCECTTFFFFSSFLCSLSRQFTKL